MLGFVRERNKTLVDDLEEPIPNGCDQGEEIAKKTLLRRRAFASDCVRFSSPSVDDGGHADARKRDGQQVAQLELQPEDLDSEKIGPERVGVPQGSDIANSEQSQ